MLELDSLVTDLIFQSGSTPDPDAFVTALGGPEVAKTRKVLDPDMQDPRFEMELSPSVPFRRRGERRLMIIDDSVAPMRADPRADPIVPLDLRPEKERLVALCEALPVRLGRLSALGSWGDAVLVAREARDLRGIALLLWALDPSVDLDGRPRASRLSRTEVEEKLLAYEKRLDELDERAILARLGPARFARQGDLLVVDVLEADGTWDLRKSLALETALAAIDQFSRIPGAPAAPHEAAPPPTGARGAAAADNKQPAQPPAQQPPEPPPEPEPAAPAGPALTAAEIGERVVLIFPRERFDLDAAAALGTRDWDAVLRPDDDLPGPMRDRVFRDGAGFVAPLEFLSEVFVDGKPLSRGDFDRDARPVGERARALEGRFPRFGPVLLVDVAGRGRFVSSELDAPEAVLTLLESATGSDR